MEGSSLGWRCQLKDRNTCWCSVWPQHSLWLHTQQSAHCTPSPVLADILHMKSSDMSHTCKHGTVVFRPHVGSGFGPDKSNWSFMMEKCPYQPLSLYQGLNDPKPSLPLSLSLLSHTHIHSHRDVWLRCGVGVWFGNIHCQPLIIQHPVISLPQSPGTSAHNPETTA